MLLHTTHKMIRALIIVFLTLSIVRPTFSQVETDSIKTKDLNTIKYEVNFVFQYGGESKLTILPKVNFYRKHNFSNIKPYYGAELGIHPLFITGAFTFSGILGVEKGLFNLETSYSYFRTTKVKDDEYGYTGPFAQNLLNLKFGFQLKTIRIKVGTSFLINEHIPTDQERISLLDIGKINNTIYGLELQFKIK